MLQATYSMTRLRYLLPMLARQVRIRDYLAKDLSAVIEIIDAALAEHGFASQATGVRRDLLNIESRYAGTRAGFWVAEAGPTNEVVGVVAIRPKEETTCELKRLYVRADWRGAGVGRALYMHAETFARNSGYLRIWLDSSRRFKGARKLYERSGFVLLAELENEWEDNVYEKCLGD
jgi:GNAT superfamily N-acetyltransferase